MKEWESMNKVVYVKAYFKPNYKEVTVKVPTCEKRTSIFGNEKDVYVKKKELVEDGMSDFIIDGERFAKDTQSEVEKLNAENYEVVSISPITSGKWVCDFKEGDVSGNIREGEGMIRGNSGYGYGYGYSFTEGMMIIAKKAND